jgi:uncharacterized membrane protein
MDELKTEYPDLKNHATKSDVAEVELKIEKVRSEIKETELKLTKEIEEVRSEIKEVEIRLSREIKETKFTMLKWQFIFWISQIAVIAGIGYKLLH